MHPDIPKGRTGYCPICGRRLKTKASQRDGIGPTCKANWLRRRTDVGAQLQLELKGRE